MIERCYEDYTKGEVVHGAGFTLTEAAIIDWALKYDPQPIHLDKLAAEQSPYKGLIASGWQVGTISFRLLVQAGLVGEASLGSPGVDELRWLRPVRPGDHLSVRVTVMDAVPSRSKPDRGVVTSFIEVLNQRTEVVLSMRALNMIARRTPG